MLKPLTPSPRIGFKVANRIAIVASRYNEEFVEPMLAKALEEIALIEPESKTQVVHAPGSFEIPYPTGHANLIAASVSDALCRMSVESGVPIIHGVLLLQNEEQAQERCLGLESNRGTEAARAAIEVIRASAAITTSGT